MKVISLIKKMKFFVMLTIICHLSYSLFEKDAPLIISGNLNHELYCQNWNATIITNGDFLEKFVQASFHPFPGYENCFSYYNVYLLLLNDNKFECNIQEGIGIDHKILDPYIQGKQGSYKVNFADLEAGNYCILFQPCAGECYNSLLHSNVVRLKEEPTITSEQNVIKESPSTKRTDIAYICVIIIFTLICSVIIYWNYKHRKLRRIPESVVENGEDLPFLSPSDTKVFIFYYPDENIQRRVDCLANFLHKCAEFNVTVIDDRRPDILFNHFAWLDAVLKCCSTVNGKCSCNKRFIIVMTESVIKYMHSLRKTAEELSELVKIKDGSYTNPSLTTDDDDMQADWFRYVLNRILVDWSKCLKDYTHFFVIYFDAALYEKDDDVITIAPSVRFTIQDQGQLMRLCEGLNCSYNDSSRKGELENYLDKHPIKNLVSNTYLRN